MGDDYIILLESKVYRLCGDRLQSTGHNIILEEKRRDAMGADYWMEICRAYGSDKMIITADQLFALIEPRLRLRIAAHQEGEGSSREGR